jgi:hypothetical protein
VSFNSDVAALVFVGSKIEALTLFETNLGNLKLNDMKINVDQASLALTLEYRGNK